MPSIRKPIRDQRIKKALETQRAFIIHHTRPAFLNKVLELRLRGNRSAKSKTYWLDERLECEMFRSGFVLQFTLNLSNSVEEFVGVGSSLGNIFLQ